MHSTTAPEARSGSPLPRRRHNGRAVPGRAWIASALLAGLLIVPSTAQAAPMDAYGVASKVVRDGAGQAQIYRLTAAAGGKLSRPGIYLDASSTASSVELGVYSGSHARAKSRWRAARSGADRGRLEPVFGRARPHAEGLDVLVRRGPARGLDRGPAVPAPVRARNSYRSSSSRLAKLPKSWRNGAKLSSDRASVLADVGVPIVQEAATLKARVAGPTAAFSWSPTTPSDRRPARTSTRRRPSARRRRAHTAGFTTPPSSRPASSRTSSTRPPARRPSRCR